MDQIDVSRIVSIFFSSLAIGYVLAQSSFLKPKKNENQDEEVQTKNPYPIRIKSLFIYPVKSLGGIQVRSIEFDKYGIVNDRRWVLVTKTEENCIYLSQKTYPKMATISTRFSDDGKQLIMSIEGMEDLKVSAEPLDTQNVDQNRMIKAKFIRDEAFVYDCGQEAADWFNKVLGSDKIRLCQLPANEYTRSVRNSVVSNLLDLEGRDNYSMSYCNSAPVMVLSQSSIDELNARVDETRAKNNEPPTEPLTWDRFRPNILVTGTQPFDEDTWREISIENYQGASIEAVFGDNNGRCPIVTIDQQIGKFDSKDEPQRTLRTFRLTDTTNNEKKTIMGMYCVIREKFHKNTSIQCGNTISIKHKDFKSNFHFPVNLPK